MTGGGSWTAEYCGTLTFQKNEAISVGESIKTRRNKKSRHQAMAPRKQSLPSVQRESVAFLQRLHCK